MDNNAEECPVCLTVFDDNLRRPRTLPCGHTFCTPCINSITEKSQVTCPSCRVAHDVPEAGQFPVSYALEALIKRLREAASVSPAARSVTDRGGRAPSPAKESSPKGPAGLSKAIRSLLQEQEAKVLAAIHTCQEVEEQLDQYQTTLVGWSERQQDLEDRLQALVDQSKRARMLMRQEESQVATKKEQVQQGEQQLQALLQTLRTVATRQQAYEAIDDADHRAAEDRQRAEECRGMFPGAHTVTTVTKVREASSAAVEAATTAQAAREPAGAVGDPGLPAALQIDFSITDRLKAMVTPSLKAQDLRSLTQTPRILVQAGLVFAVHRQEGRSRYARFSLEDNSLYLHSLQDQPPPPRAAILEMDEVVPAVPPWLVFLDLKWPGSARRRVCIRLRTDTPWGRQFLLLCTGQRGPCYANTRLCEVVYKGQPGEWVCGGDYEHNNGTGGAALLPNLDKGEYRRSRRAGAVWGVWGDPAWGAVFCITTRDGQDSAHSVFGHVVSGLDGVAAAALHSPITEVTIMDCGVVLWE